MKQFIKMSFVDFKGHLGPFRLEEFLTLNILNPFLTLVFYCLLAGYTYKTSDLTSWVIGNSFLLCTSVCIFSLGIVFTREKQCGRIRSIICSPLSKLQIMLQKGFFPCLVCILTTLVGFLLGGVFFHVPLGKIHWGLYGCILGVAMVGACSFGLAIGAIGLLTDQMHLILNTVSAVMLIFTGTNFPVAQLPFWGRGIAKVLPLTRSVEAAKLLCDDFTMEQIMRLLLGEVLLSVCYLIIARLILVYAEHKAIKEGTLELF
ncbi:ABC transporter permease [Anaerosporobacter faecicola]|uniref:ABC transporter permease n=1 Tax=Anaerosporobacter faecicola TaxID=2718714 RepID=UPI001438A13E|nr:ABC transporter permease [Anaerosporobacter faecicola]